MFSNAWFLLLAILFIYVQRGETEQIPFIPCGDKIFSSLYVTPCNGTVLDGWQTCVLRHGDLVNFEAFFVAPFNSSSFQVATMITLEGVEVPSINSGYDPCFGNITPSCPVTEGKTYLFHRYYNIQSEFPTGSMDLRLVIRDMETKEVAACAKIPVIIDKNPEYMYLD